MASSVEQIKERLSIVDVVGSYLKLQKAGANFKAVCPFHHEKTPSFFISPERNSFYCFGCGAKGDIISFIEQFEGLDFMGALKLLADKAGVQLVFEAGGERGGERNEKERLYKILELATAHFAQKLSTVPAAREYLEMRGVSEETITKFRLGFAPDDWHGVSLYLKGKGYSDIEIEKAGLSKRTEKGFYDRFRSRIMFPLTDAAGRPVGFSGRIFGKEDVTAAKYVNSPETALFQKSKLLFGYDKAKLAIRQENVAVVVEGQMDLVLSHQAGVENAVAVSGTALTDEHLTTLSRLASVLLLAFDADGAGFRAALRSAKGALASGLLVKVVQLPEKLDPADLILKDSGAWKTLIQDAIPLIDFLMLSVKRRSESETELRRSTEELVLPYVAALKSNIEQAHYVNKIAASLKVSEEPVWKEVRKRVEVEERRKETPLSGKKSIRQEEIVKRLLGVLLWQEKKTTPDIDISIIEKELERLLEGGYKKEKAAARTEEQSIMLGAEVLYGASTSLADEVTSLLLQLEEDLLKEKLSAATFELRRLEGIGTVELIASQLETCQRLSATLQKIGKEKAKREKEWAGG